MAREDDIKDRSLSSRRRRREGRAEEGRVANETIKEQSLDEGEENNGRKVRNHFPTGEINLISVNIKYIYIVFISQIKSILFLNYKRHFQLFTL